MAKSRTESLDFGGVPKERRQRFRRIPEGTYRAKIVSHKKGWKDNDKSNPPYYRWTFQIIEGKYKGVPFTEITSLKSDALFNLRNLIFAASDGKKNVAGKKIDFNPTSLYGKEIGIVVEDEEYDNKMRSNVADVIPPSEIEDDDDDEDSDDEDEDEVDEDEEEDEEDDDEDLDEVDTDNI